MLAKETDCSFEQMLHGDLGSITDEMFQVLGLVHSREDEHIAKLPENHKIQ